MRYGILSDVHGNIDALAVVLDGLAELQVDAYVFLGDAVGYGANPNEVCERLRSMKMLAVIGNHDAAVAGRMDYSDYYGAARDALAWCTEHMHADNMQWLRSLPYRAQQDGIDFCHGSPFAAESFDYLFAAGQVGERIGEIGTLAPVTFIGHSHLTVSFCIEGKAVSTVVAASIECRADARYIITVGSVGQPRDRDPRACCGIYDTDKRLFTYHRFEYDVRSARRKILDAGLPSAFGDRLLVGV